MAIGTPVQVANVGGTTTGVTTGSFTPAANSVIFAWLSERNASATPAKMTVSDSLGLTWTEVTTQIGPLSNAFMRGTLYWATSTNTSMTVTGTGTGTNSKSVEIVTVPMDAPDFSNFNGGSQTGVAACTAALAGTPAAVIGFSTTQAGTAATQNSGLTEIVDAVPTGLTSQLRQCVAYDLTSPTATLSMTTNNNALLVALELLEDTGGDTITGSLFTNTNTFSTAIVGRGAVAVTGSLYTDADTFGTNVVSSLYSVVGQRYDDPDTFGTAVVSVGAVAITGVLYVDPDTFGTNAVSAGTAAITADRFDNTNTFGSNTVSQGAAPQAITAARLNNINTFGANSLATVAYVTGARYNDPDTFYSATIEGGTPTPGSPGDSLVVIYRHRR